METARSHRGLPFDPFDQLIPRNYDPAAVLEHRKVFVILDSTFDHTEKLLSDYFLNLPSIYLIPDGHNRKKTVAGRMRRFRQYLYRNSFFGNRNHISRSGYPFQPITYLSRLHAGCIALQKYHYSLIPCHGQSTDTVLRSTRRVIDRSSVFLRSHGAHIRQLVLPDRGESSPGILSIQLSKIGGKKDPLKW